MMNQHTISASLQHYLDGTCTPQEAADIENRIATHPEWKACWESLQETEQLLSHPDLLIEPPLRFTKNVMEAVAEVPMAKPVSARVSKLVFLSITGLLTMSLLLILVGGILHLPGSAAGYSISIPAPNWKHLSGNLLWPAMGINILLACWLIDRWWGYRKKQHTRA